MDKKRIAVIGSGFSGLSAASYLAKKGYSVCLFEKNSTVGGRARLYSQGGFTFDLGPSWYWMPDVFEKYFADFGKKTSDYYQIKKLDPGFSIVFDEGIHLPIPADYAEIKAQFEKLESGSGVKLDQFLEEAEKKYTISMDEIVYMPSKSIFEFIRWDIIKNVLTVDFFKPLRKSLQKYFSNPYLLKTMEFPVLFLGAMADKIPALYSIMNYAALKQGTFYPMGGMYEVVKGMEKLAVELGVEIYTSSEVTEIIVENKLAVGIEVGGKTLAFDAVVASADYEFVERKLLAPQYRNYSENYWNSRTFAPSSLLFYLGINTKIPKLDHHTLFFDAPFDQHAHEIYTHPQWPSNPLFYVSATSKTDPTVAPEGMENLVILIPLAVGLEDTPELRKKYYDMVMTRLEKFCEIEIRSHIISYRDYCKNDFIEEYNSYKGNAYGLANTLFQTGPLKPKLINKKIKNLLYAGQLTVPGPGVPPSLISGKVVANELAKLLE